MCHMEKKNCRLVDSLREKGGKEMKVWKGKEIADKKWKMKLKRHFTSLWNIKRKCYLASYTLTDRTC